jgi:hypothetical protein
MASANLIVSATFFALLSVFALGYGYWLYRRYYYVNGPKIELLYGMKATRLKTPVSVNSYVPIMNAQQFLTYVAPAMRSPVN